MQVEAVEKVLPLANDTSKSLSPSCAINRAQAQKDLLLVQKVHAILDGWVIIVRSFLKNDNVIVGSHS